MKGTSERLNTYSHTWNYKVLMSKTSRKACIFLTWLSGFTVGAENSKPPVVKAGIRSVSCVMNDTLAKTRGFRGGGGMQGTARVTVCSKQDPEFIAEADV